MKVSSNNPIQIVDPRLKAESPANKVEFPSNGSNGYNLTTVSISGKAGEAAQIRDGVERSPEIRMELVNKIKAEVDAGNYQRPASAVAEKLITESLFDSLYHS